MANNYIAKIRAELDSGSLQEQINKIVKNSGTIKIKVEADGDISGFIKDISKKVESAGNVSIKPKVDVSEIDSSFGTLSKTITRIVGESKESVENVYKSIGNGFDVAITEVDGKTKSITENYESYAKRISALERQINTEFEKTSSYISKMKDGTAERIELEEKLKNLSSSGISEDALSKAKQLTAEAKEKFNIESKELAIQERISNQIKEIKTRMEAVKMSSSQRLEIEKKIEDAMAMENSKDRLSALKNINTEITAMGKNAMSLGAMLQTAYEKFAIWSVATVSWYAVVHAVQDMVDNIIELDKSLTELQKVTDLTGSSLDAFVEKAYNVGSQIAKTGQEVVDATTEFAKAGYDVEESLDLAEDALLWTNISDGMVEVSDASNMIIANLKAFDKQGISSRHIIDSLNEVNNCL